MPDALSSATIWGICVDPHMEKQVQKIFKEINRERDFEMER